MCFSVQSGSSNFKEQETLITDWNLTSGHGKALFSMPVQSYQGPWMGCCKPASHCTILFPLIDFTQAKQLYTCTNYSMCNTSACLLPRGSMPALYVEGYHIAAIINYLTACYDIALGGQND